MTNIFFSAINLGCSKNLIETQHIIGQCLKFNHDSTDYTFVYCSDPYDEIVRFVFVNTCGFLSSGRKEMLETLTDLIDAGKSIYVFGCGVQYFHYLRKKCFQKKHCLDQADENTRMYEQRILLLTKYGGKKIFLLTWSDIDYLTPEKLLSGWQSSVFSDFTYSSTPRAYTNIHFGFEYVKIAEGCNNRCSFCIIPQIRGKQKSRPLEQIVSEVRYLISLGVKEIILLAQDTTRYGSDIYGRYALMDLVSLLEKMEGDFRYRLLYLYPDILTFQWLEKLALCKKFIPYFDIPFQHVSLNILKCMGRFYGQKTGNVNQKIIQKRNNKKKQTNWIIDLIAYIRALFPISFIRTNFIIGFPGETNEDHAMLLNLLEQSLFDNVALFMYHDEPFATSRLLPFKIPDDIIEKRFLEAKKILEKIYKNKKSKHNSCQDWGYVVGIKTKTPKTSRCLTSFDGKTIKNNKNVRLIVRPRLHAPNIDEVIEISLSNIKEIIDGETIRHGVRVRWGR